MTDLQIKNLIKLHERQVAALVLLQEARIRLNNRLFSLNHEYGVRNFERLRERLQKDILINKRAIIRIERYYEKLTESKTTTRQAQ